MADNTKTMSRPQRWDEPFGGDMSEADVAEALRVSVLADIDASKFPDSSSLHEILLNDARIIDFKQGDIVVREGDYGNSAFIILSGQATAILNPALPPKLLGRQPTRKKGLLQKLAMIMGNRKIAEKRDLSSYAHSEVRTSKDPAMSHTFIQDLPAVLDKHNTASLTKGTLFGELAALGRIPRSVSVVTEQDSRLLEIRWQGLRDIRRYDVGFRTAVDERYRQNALSVHLEESALFKTLGDNARNEILQATLFETQGSFDWHVSYKKLREKGDKAKEPVIARQGDYADGLIMIRAGFARVSVKMGAGERTLTYLGAGDVYGLNELYQAWQGEAEPTLETSLSAVGYVDLLRVPTPYLEKYVFKGIQQAPTSFLPLANQTLDDASLLEWSMDERLINGTQAMLIDLDRCVRCDDCVRACAATHDGNPRFIRHGKTFDHWMVANACMHCMDPVCMIGCPTGAIQRIIETGVVTINDRTCIGCGTCANSCPYHNIRLVDVRDDRGEPIRDEATQKTISKATKCDFCFDLKAGPACVRACPHDALRRVQFNRDEMGVKTP